jgi:hypothetical protein
MPTDRFTLAAPNVMRRCISLTKNPAPRFVPAHPSATAHR